MSDSPYRNVNTAKRIQGKIKKGMKEVDAIRLIGQDLKNQGYTSKQVSYFLNVDEDFISDVLGALSFKSRKILYLKSK